MHRSDVFIEVRVVVNRSGKPKLIRYSELGDRTGYQSVYAYDKETAEEIRLAGSTSGLRGTPVYSDTLFVDFDGTDPTPLISYLEAEGIAFDQYDSGNRSVHLHIHTEPIFGAWVPLAHKLFIKKHGPGADMSFYNPSGQYRLPGTYHVKGGGKRKELVRTVPGKKLLLEEPAIADAPVPISRDGSIEQLLTAAQLLRRPGQRSPHIWLMGKMASEAGLSYEEALEHVSWWNKRFCVPPQDTHTIERQVLEGYKQTEWGAYAASQLAERCFDREVEDTGS